MIKHAFTEAQDTIKIQTSINGKDKISTNEDVEEVILNKSRRHNIRYIVIENIRISTLQVVKYTVQGNWASKERYLYIKKS